MASQSPNQLPGPLNNHHQDDDVESFPCPIPNCNKVYATRRALHGHFKAHSTKFLRSAKQQIKMPATDVDDEDSSTAVVSYDCPRCPKTYTRPQALYGHLKRHPGNWSGFIKKKMLVVKFYTCLRCWKSFLLRQVINIKHEEESRDGGDDEREEDRTKAKFFFCCFRCKKKLQYYRRSRSLVQRKAVNGHGNGEGSGAARDSHQIDASADDHGDELNEDELVSVAVAGLMMLLQQAQAGCKFDLNRAPPPQDEEESRRVFKFDLNKPLEEEDDDEEP